MPVFGLRPMRSFFLRTMKDPNDESLTVSPSTKPVVISLKTSSTMAKDSDRDSPTFWWTASQRSTRVTFLPAMVPPIDKNRSPCIMAGAKDQPLFAVRAHETKLGSSRREDFWFIVAARSEDETEIRAGQSSGRTSSEEHSASDTPAVLG